MLLVNEKIKFAARKDAPNPREVTYWIDLTEDPEGRCWKYFDGESKVWKVFLLGVQEGTLDAYSKAESDKKFATNEAVNSIADQLNDKQDILESGVNIKTINGLSLIGSGDIYIDRGLNQNQVQDLIDESTKDFITVDETHDYVQDEIAKLKLVVLNEDRLPQCIRTLIAGNDADYNELVETLKTTDNHLLYVTENNEFHRFSYNEEYNYIRHDIKKISGHGIVEHTYIINQEGTTVSKYESSITPDMSDNTSGGIKITTKTSTEGFDRDYSIVLHTQKDGRSYLANDGTYKILGSVNLYTSMDRLPDCLAVLMDDDKVQVDRFITAKQYLTELNDKVYLLLTDIYNEDPNARTIESNQLYSFCYDQDSDSIFIVGSIDPLYQIYNDVNPQPRVTEVTQITNSATIIRRRISDGIYSTGDGFDIRLEDNSLNSIEDPEGSAIIRHLSFITEGNGKDVLFNDGIYRNLQNSIDFSNYLAKDNTEPYTPTGKYNPATKKYVDDEIAGLVDSAPEALDTLNELAAALGDDPNFATTMINELAKKVDKADVGDVNDLLTESKVIVDAINEHEKQINTNTEAIANINTNISNIEQDLADEIEQRKQADTQLQTNINNETTARQQADNQLQTNIDAESSARQEADSKLQTNIDTEASERKKEDTAIREEIKNINTDITEDISNINSSINNINQSITNINNKNNSQDQAIADLQEDVTNINNDITTIEGNITNINSSITEIKGDISTIEVSVSTIQNTVTNIQGDITDIKNDINSVEGNITNITNEITNIKNGSALPIASSTQLGGVKIGSGVNVTADGTISVAEVNWDNIEGKPDSFYTLPVATDTVLGGIKSTPYVINKEEYLTDGNVVVPEFAFISDYTTYINMNAGTSGNPTALKVSPSGKISINLKEGYNSTVPEMTQSVDISDYNVSSTGKLACQCVIKHEKLRSHISNKRITSGTSIQIELVLISDYDANSLDFSNMFCNDICLVITNGTDCCVTYCKQLQFSSSTKTIQLLFNISQEFADYYNNNSIIDIYTINCELYNISYNGIFNYGEKFIFTRDPDYNFSLNGFTTTEDEQLVLNLYLPPTTIDDIENGFVTQFNETNSSGVQYEYLTRISKQLKYTIAGTTQPEEPIINQYYVEVESDGKSKINIPTASETTDGIITSQQFLDVVDSREYMDIYSIDTWIGTHSSVTQTITEPVTIEVEIANLDKVKPRYYIMHCTHYALNMSADKNVPHYSFDIIWSKNVLRPTHAYICYVYDRDTKVMKEYDYGDDDRVINYVTFTWSISNNVLTIKNENIPPFVYINKLQLIY